MAPITIATVQAERQSTNTYVLAGIILLPHYTKKDVWVAPGGREFERHYLVLFGAEMVRAMLWPRYY